jgi:hypothetical protein
MILRLLLLTTLAAPLVAWADIPGLRLYEEGDYEAAVVALEQVLAEPGCPAPERGVARMYLAAALHALGRLDEAREQLEVLAREHPEQRLDPARFLPELVALWQALVQRMETEREYAERERQAREEAERERQAREEAERERQAREEAARERQAREEAERERRAWAIRLRPEAVGLIDTLDGTLLPGVGLGYSQGPFEAGVRAWLVRRPVFNLQGGVLVGPDALKAHLGLRGTLASGTGGSGGGFVIGGRLTLPAGLVAVLDVGAEYFFIRGRDVEGNEINPFALTALAGVGLSLDLTPPVAGPRR